MDAWDKLERSFEPFFATPGYPYTAEESRLISTDPRAVLDAHFPGAWDWFEQRGIKLRPAITQYSNEKAKDIMGWVPEHTFARWWRANRQ
jgi:hypothetical protein